MKIGTRVKIIDVLKHFPCFTEMFKKMGFKDAENHRKSADFMFMKNAEFIVFAKRKQEASRTVFYGIIDQKGNQYLFEKEGLQKIKKSKKVKEYPTEEVKEKPFPKVMKAKSSELIVHFDKKGVGRVLQSNDKHNIGYFSDDWAMRTFEDIKEPITITFN
jgi:hypothetical protein